MQIDATDKQAGVMTAVTQHTFDPLADLATPALVLYENNDGHKHWHLRHAARYSLWDEAGAAEVAPASKVGFCLVDSQDVGDPGPGTYFDSCQRDEDDDPTDGPAATAVTMGLSPGWRDRYPSNLWMQWVDVSNVAPGRYLLRGEVDPDNVVEETDEVNLPADTPFTIPGYRPRAGTAPLEPQGSTVVRLRGRRARREPRPAAVPHRRAAEPRDARQAARPVVRRDDRHLHAGARLERSRRRLHLQRPRARRALPALPPRAAVALDGPDAPPGVEQVAISGAPAEMVAGTTVRLTASVRRRALVGDRGADLRGRGLRGAAAADGGRRPRHRAERGLRRGRHPDRRRAGAAARSDGVRAGRRRVVPSRSSAASAHAASTAPWSRARSPRAAGGCA